MGIGAGMRKGQYPEEKIVAILKEETQTSNAAEVSRRKEVNGKKW